MAAPRAVAAAFESIALHAAAMFGSRWRAARDEARRKALEDQLTGLANARAFAERAAGGPADPVAQSGEIVLLMYDIDGLAAITDRFERKFGDFVLRLFAEKARAEMRANDLLFRLGADEFCAILPGTSLADAEAIANRVRAAFREKPLRARKKQNVRPTACVGLASSQEVGFGIDRLKAAAEEALRQAKCAGADSLCVYRASAPAALAAPAAA